MSSPPDLQLTLTTDALVVKQRRIAFAAVVLGSVMAVLDATLLNIALPTITGALHTTAASSVFVINAYLVACAVMLLPFASLGDIVGHRRVYLWGMAIFTVASGACALAPTLGSLVAMRIVQGLGCAAVVCGTLALLRQIFPPAVLGAVLGMNALTIAAATTAGPAIGGIVVSYFSWRWLFGVNVPIGMLAIVLALRSLPAAKPTPAPFDTSGALLSAASIAAFMLGIDDLALAARHTAACAELALAMLLLVAFVRHQRRSAYALLPLDMFRSRRFAVAALTSLLCFVAQGIAFVSMPFLFQKVFGVSPVESAMLFTPWPLAIAFCAPLAGRLADRASAGAISTAGAAAFAAGLAALACLDNDPATWDVCWRTALCGVGFGVFQTPNNREMLSNVPSERTGKAAGVLHVVRTLGQALGAAVVSILLALAAIGGGAPAAEVHGEARASSHALWVACCCACVAAMLSVSRAGARRADTKPNAGPLAH